MKGPLATLLGFVITDFWLTRYITCHHRDFFSVLMAIRKRMSPRSLLTAVVYKLAKLCNRQSCFSQSRVMLTILSGLGEVNLTTWNNQKLMFQCSHHKSFSPSFWGNSKYLCSLLWDRGYVCKPRWLDSLSLNNHIIFSVCARCNFCIFKRFNLWLKPTLSNIHLFKSFLFRHFNFVQFSYLVDFYSITHFDYLASFVKVLI